MSPHLFVICMEYLSRQLRSLHEVSGFQYHPKCAAIKLAHLGFADDLLMFCKGNESSVEKMMEMFETFTRASGLQANLQKSELFCTCYKTSHCTCYFE